jgi:hypothetical protein
MCGEHARQSPADDGRVANGAQRGSWVPDDGEGFMMLAKGEVVGLGGWCRRIVWRIVGSWLWLRYMLMRVEKMVGELMVLNLEELR